MKLFETRFDGQTFGYILGQGGVERIVKKADKVSVTVKHDTLGSYTTTFDLSKLPMHTIG